MMGTIQKLGRVADPCVRPDMQVVDVGQIFDGEYDDEPKVGESFHIRSAFHTKDSPDRCYPHLLTSRVMSIYVVGGEDWDHLVLPGEFPDPKTIDWPHGITPGDTLFVTMNSLYWLHPDRKI